MPEHMAAGCLTRPSRTPQITPSTPQPFRPPSPYGPNLFLRFLHYANTNSLHLQELWVNLDTIIRSQCLSRNPSRHLRHLVQTHHGITVIHRHTKKIAQTNMLTDKIVCLRPPRNGWWRSWWAWDTSRNSLFFDDAASSYTIWLSISETENTGSGSGDSGRRRRA